MTDRKVFKIVKRPARVKNVMKSRMIFKRKLDGRYKSRLCAKGFTQKQGIDYGETFAPTVKATSIRLFWFLTVHLNNTCKGFDVSAAFLYGAS